MQHIVIILTESSSGVITNITDDPIPTLTNNPGDTFNGQDLFYIIESRTNGDIKELIVMVEQVHKISIQMKPYILCLLVPNISQ